ncbi:MAG: hypothetical protein HYX63_21850 [Gammaproteobacteria bacterium]|nr:hypothetical protein [Gammaproteobacteria bacterium]
MHVAQMERLIRASRNASNAIDSFGEKLEDAAAAIKYLEGDSKQLNERSRQYWRAIAEGLIVRYIWNADKWQPREPRLKLIKDLEGLSRAATAERLRAYKSVTIDAFKALLLDLPVGPALIAALRDLKRDSDLGLEGKRQRPSTNGLVFGFDNPVSLLDGYETNLHMMKRSFAHARSSTGSALLKRQPVRWRLNEPVIQAFLRARRVGNDRDFSLHDIRGRLTKRNRDNLARCAKQAARLVEINFHLTDRQRNPQLNESLESWRHAYPLSRFVVSVFEEVAKSMHIDLIDVEASTQRRRDRLTRTVIDVAHEGIKAAVQVVRSIPEFANIDLDAGVALMAISDEVRKEEKQIARELGQALHNVNDTSKAVRETWARTAIVDRLWQLRQSIITLKAYCGFMNWYIEHAERSVANDLIPSLRLVRRHIWSGLLDWSNELQARYWDGILFTRDMKVRASGSPLNIPRMPAAVEKAAMTVRPYRLNAGVDDPGQQGDATIKKYPKAQALHQGAVVQEEVLDAIVSALCQDQPETLRAWRELTRAIPPHQSRRDAF